MLWQPIVLQWLFRIRVLCIIGVQCGSFQFCTVVCIKIIQPFVRKIFCGLFCASNFCFRKHQYAICAFGNLVKIFHKFIRSFFAFTNELRQVSHSPTAKHSNVALPVNPIPFHIPERTFLSTYSRHKYSPRKSQFCIVSYSKYNTRPKRNPFYSGKPPALRKKLEFSLFSNKPY